MGDEWWEKAQMLDLIVKLIKDLIVVQTVVLIVDLIVVQARKLTKKLYSFLVLFYIFYKIW